MTNRNPDEALRNLLFRHFRTGIYEFDFLEGLLAVCITVVACFLRTPFESGLPHWPYLLAEWYLAVLGAVLVWNLTGGRKRTIITYGILLILPTVIADGTILRNNASVGAVLFISALLFFFYGRTWLFTAAAAFLLLWSVRYVGILFACAVLWQMRKIKSEQFLLLLAAGGVRFVRAYHAWLGADYSVLTFHWPNIYEILGKESVSGQLIDPAAYVGVFLTLGLMLLFIRVLGFGTFRADDYGNEENEAGKRESKKEAALMFRLLLFFGLAAGYFLPYMDQSYGYLYCILAVLYLTLEPGQFAVPLLLQIITFTAYQENFRGSSMMPMVLFSVVQFLVIVWLGIQLLQEAEVIPSWKRKN